jgi:peptidoglycan/LPS O-acetylase OafA/YrhL
VATEPSAAPSLRAALRHRHLPALDGLRAVAVLTVITYHFGYAAVPGDLGVSLFFVLSGFLITWLLLGEHEATGTFSLRAFYARRVLRIFPAYYVFIAASYAIDTWRGQAWPQGLRTAALVYGVNYFNAFHHFPASSISHAWSLAVEEQFYILWPLLLLFLMRKGPRTVWRVLVGIIVLVVAWRSYLYLARGVGSAYVYDAFDTRFDNLAIGCLVAVLLRNDAAAAVASRLGRRSWMPLVTLALIVCSRTGGTASYHYSAGFTVDGVLLAVFMMQVMTLSTTTAWRWLNHRVVRYVGRVSYPMYLYHGWALEVGHHAHGVPKIAQFAIGTLATVAVASGSYFVIEKPFLRLKRRFEASGTRAGVRANGSAVLARPGVGAD